MNLDKRGGEIYTERSCRQEMTWKDMRLAIIQALSVGLPGKKTYQACQGGKSGKNGAQFAFDTRERVRNVIGNEARYSPG